MGSSEPEALREITALLATPFLAYTTAASEDEIKERLEGRVQTLGGKREAALANTLDMASCWAWPEPDAAPARPEGSAADRMRRFGWFDLDAEQTMANRLRTSAGGEIPRTPDGLDPAEQILATIAIDYFPVTLLPPPRPEKPATEPPIVATSRVTAFAEAITGDTSLHRLLTAEPAFFTSTGFGYSAPNATRIVECCIATAELRVRIMNRRRAADFIDAALESLQIVRELSQFGQAEAPAIIGFAHVEVPEDMRLRGPRGGTLRSATQADLKMPYAAPATMVLETRAVVALHIGEAPPDAGDFYRGLGDLRHDAELIGLSGLLLRDPATVPALPVETWTKVFDPLQPYVGSFKRARDTATSAKLRPNELPEFEYWLAQVERHHHPAVRIATRRAITALSEREADEDSLIDLMIALESLFGTRTGELTFRISSALSWLLGRNADKRVQIQRDAKSAYAVRSQIVHGADVADAKIAESQARAKRLLLGSLKALFSERMDLISDPERSNKLVLDQPKE